VIGGFDTALPAPRRGRVLLEWAFVGLLASTLVLWLAMGDALQRPNGALYDQLMRLRGGAPDDAITLVAIDNRSLQAIGRWPWSRQVHAELVDRLAALDARAVGYDVLFTEPTAEDDVLAGAIERAGRVYLPMAVDPLGEDGAPWRLIRPLPELAAAAAGLGHVNLTADDDGVVRRLPYALQAGDVIWPHLAVKLFTASGRPSPDVAPGRLAGPAAAADAPLLAWRGPPGRFRTVSAIDLLRGETPPDALSGKLVLVGMTADGQGDRYAGPTSAGGRLFSGVEIQAVLLDSLLSEAAVLPLARGAVAGLSLLAVWCLMIGFLVLRPGAGLALAVGLGAAAFASCAAAFAEGIWATPLAAAAGLVLAYPLWSWRRLAAASAYMQAEIVAFSKSGEALQVQGGGDIVWRQVEAMSAALARLRDLGRFIADALTSLPDATLVVDDRDTVLMANTRAAALFGGAALPGRRLSELLADLTGADGEPSSADEVVTATGAVMKIDSAPLVDAAGRPAARIVRLADLTAIRTALRQREEALQLLSHDLRAPQSAILALLEGSHDRSDPAFERRIGDSARMTLKLAESYVQLARAESQPLVNERLDLTAVMIDAADLLWPQTSERGVRVATYLPQEATGLGERTLLTRLFLNLIDNAIKFAPEGSTIGCSIVRKGAVWRCAVVDQGPGPSDAMLPFLFQPFRRERETVAGAGLGLAYVAAVARRHGGRAFYERGPEGSAFGVELPTA
jgi:CHASE2 domain-containing sensor protein/signal transduction histidine kinase